MLSDESFIGKDTSGVALDTLCGTPMEPGRFLPLAIGITTSLAELHKQNIIHMSISPRTILINPETFAVTITGFSPASRLPDEYPAQDAEVAPAYMSPEQTGRMNRVVDHRSDLYSLGVTLYEMLTGTLPCQASGILEWVHCHIARSPRPPIEVAPEPPRMLSDIVMKLLAKNPEERYQTAFGLKSDLERCLELWEASREIEPFPPGERDISDRLMIPQKLYGREDNIADLMSVFNRVVECGAPELVMVAGYSGIGKTSLVRELYQPVVRERGFFISGKFDQFKRNIPYATIVDAFRELIQQILAESEDQIAGWKRQLQSALGINGQLIVEVVPHIELIVGQQPSVPELPPTEAQNRFNMVFRQFVAVFAQKEHPLVVFLDDLQWVDSATLKLIEQIITHPDMQYLLLIGAYRDNEVTPPHPLMLTLDDIRKSRMVVQTITLSPLFLEDVGHIMTDTFRCDKARCEPLTRLVHEKTAGNPFFVIQFLKALHDEGLVEFDQTELLWKWDIVRIREKGYTDNVVDLMVGKLRKLSGRTLQEMWLAACIGNRFDLHTLAMISSISDQETRESLVEVLREGLLLRLNGVYSFLHDRIQEAAYSLVPEEDQAGLHLRIGRLLISHLAEEEIEERVFDVVNQLNRGAGLVTEPREKALISRLNQIAGRKAKGAIAYTAALAYFAQATALLPPDAWSAYYEETFSLYLDLSECEYLVGDFQGADQLFDLLFANARSDLDRAWVYRLRMRLYQIAGRFSDALRAALDALQLFGVVFPDSDQEIQAATEAEIREVAINLRGRRIADLLDAPGTTDPTIKMIISLIAEPLPAAYIARPQHFALLTMKGVNLSLRHGNVAESSGPYSAYAIILVSIGDIPSAFDFSELAVGLVEKYDAPREKGVVLLRHSYFIHHWRRHIATTLPYVEECFLVCRELGDFFHAGYALVVRVLVGLEKGDPLGEVLELSGKVTVFARETHNETLYQSIRVWQQFITCLQGLTREPISFDDDTFDEAGTLAYFRETGVGSAIALYHILKQIAAFINGRYAAALESALRAAPMLHHVMAVMPEADYHFYGALTLTALYPEASATKQQEFMQTLDDELRRHKLWADSCPENFENRHALVSAEVARIEGREIDAERLYEQAIRSARENGFVQNEGLAYELASNFYRGREFDLFANTYIRQARACYARWGAGSKLKQLDEQYPWLQEEEEKAAAKGMGAQIGRVDAITVAKASQAISGEILLSNLLDTLMRIVIENAGAQRGYLILAHGDELSVEAQAWVKGEEIEVRQESAPLSAVLPLSMANYVERTRQSVILNDASEMTMFSSDAYILVNKPVSVLCLPVLRQSDLIGLLYLENNLVKGAFTADRIAVLELLAAQAAISLENSMLYTALGESKRLLLAIIDNSTAVVYVKDLEGRYLLINRRFEELFHVTREAAAGKTDHDLFPKVRADAFRDFDRQVLTTGTAMEAEEIAPQDDGLHTYISIKAPLYDAAGIPYATCGISADITERKRAEEALLKAHEELEQRIVERTRELSEANLKLKELDHMKSMFIASTSHELRTPLNAIIGFTGMTLQGLSGKLNEEQQDNLTRAYRSAKHLLELITDIIDISKIEAGKIGTFPEEFPLEELVGKAIALVTPQLQVKGLPLEREIPAGLTMYADRKRLLQCLTNLLSNAAKFTEKGKIVVTAREAQGRIELSVTDSGIGIAEGDLPRLFKPFERLESHLRVQAGGTGLGLYLTAKLVADILRGTISVQSREGEGTTFTLSLPRDLRRVPEMTDPGREGGGTQ